MLQMILKKRPVGQIGTITLDASLSYSHDRSNSISAFPVEKGSPITDHVRAEPLQVRIDGFVTNSPLSLYGRASVINSLTTFQGDPKQSIIDRVFDELNRLDDSKEPFTVITGMSRYDNMVFRTLSIPRDGRSGEALQFSATMQQITIVDPKLVTLPNVQSTVTDKATNNIKTGSDTTTDTTDKAKAKVSTIKRGINRVATSTAAP